MLTRYMILFARMVDIDTMVRFEKRFEARVDEDTTTNVGAKFH